MSILNTGQVANSSERWPPGGSLPQDLGDGGRLRPHFCSWRSRGPSTGVTASLWREEGCFAWLEAGTASSQTARLTLQTAGQEVRSVQLGGERELTESKAINARAELFARAFSVLSVTRTGWGVREAGEPASDTPPPLAALSPVAVRVSFLRPVNPGNLPRSRSLTTFKRRIYRDFDGR